MTLAGHRKEKHAYIILVRKPEGNRSRYKHKVNITMNFMFCWPCISVWFLPMTNLTHFFHVFIYFTSLHVSNSTVFIIKRWSIPSWPVYQAVTYIDQYIPDDVLIQSISWWWTLAVWNMQRGEVNKYIKEVHQVGHWQESLQWIFKSQGCSR